VEVINEMLQEGGSSEGGEGYQPWASIHLLAPRKGTWNGTDRTGMQLTLRGKGGFHCYAWLTGKHRGDPIERRHLVQSQAEKKRREGSPKILLKG